MKLYPRCSFPELSVAAGPEGFHIWARENHREAVDFGYGDKTVSAPNQAGEANRLVDEHGEKHP